MSMTSEQLGEVIADAIATAIKAERERSLGLLNTVNKAILKTVQSHNARLKKLEGDDTTTHATAARELDELAASFLE